MSLESLTRLALLPLLVGVFSPSSSGEEGVVANSFLNVSVTALCRNELKE